MKKMHETLSRRSRMRSEAIKKQLSTHLNSAKASPKRPRSTTWVRPLALGNVQHLCWARNFEIVWIVFPLRFSVTFCHFPREDWSLPFSTTLPLNFDNASPNSTRADLTNDKYHHTDPTRER